MNDEVLAEVRAIGASTASAPGVYQRDTVEARVAALLADPDDPAARAIDAAAAALAVRPRGLSGKPLRLSV